MTDANGFAVAGVPVNFTIAGGGTATAQVVTNAAGIAFSIWQLGPNPGVQTLTATAPGIPESVVFTATAVIPGPAASYSAVLTRTAPVGGQPLLPPNGIVRDAAGYVVGGTPVTFTLTAGRGGTITPALPATIVTDANGGAGLTSWVADTLVGIDSVRIDVAGMPSPLFFTLTRTPLAPSFVEFTTSPPSAAAAAVLTPPVRISVRDRYNNLGTNATGSVTLELIGTGGGTLGGTTTVPLAAGVAEFSNLTVSAPGSYQLRATYGTIVATSSPFTITP